MTTSMQDTDPKTPASMIDALSELAADPPRVGASDPSLDVEFAHLDEPTRRVMRAPLAERIAHALGDAIVVHPALATLLNEARWMIREPRRFRARGLIIFAPPGNGKTAISEILCREFPLAHHPADSAPGCALAISLAGARTTRAIFERIHKALNTELGKGTVSFAEQRVHAMLTQCMCRLLILDEAQDLLGIREGEQQRVIESLKYLMNALKLPILALGTEKAVQAFKADPHMQARFRAAPLTAWKADDALATFLRHYEQHLPFPQPSRLDNPLILKHLVALSDGVLDPMLICLRDTAIRLIAQGANLMTLHDIQQTAPRPDVTVMDQRS